MRKIKEMMIKNGKDGVFINLDLGSIEFKKPQEIDDNSEYKYLAFLDRHVAFANVPISEAYGWLVTKDAIIDVEDKMIYYGKDTVEAFKSAYGPLDNAMQYDEWTIHDIWQQSYREFSSFLKKKGGGVK